MGVAEAKSGLESEGRPHMTTPAISITIPDGLLALREVYEPRPGYDAFRDIERHLECAAGLAAISTMRDVCEDERVHTLLGLNPHLCSFWEVSWLWYTELINSLVALFPDQERQVRHCADNQRNLALLAVKW